MQRWLSAAAQRTAMDRSGPEFEFHVSRAARDRYRFDAALFTLSGNVILADPQASRDFAARIQQVRAQEGSAAAPIAPAALHAMGLIDEALHAMIAAYRRRNPRALTAAVPWLGDRVGGEAVEITLHRFAVEFPVVRVYRGELRAEEWLAGESGGYPHRAVAVEEMLLLWLANANPAFAPFRELFDDRPTMRGTAYGKISSLWQPYFAAQPGFGPGGAHLLDLLLAPQRAAPDSLRGQLAFIRERWRWAVGEIWEKLGLTLGALQEEELALWRQFHPPAGGAFGPGPAGDSSPAAVPHFSEFEYERFSSDVDWMPRAVLLAKNAYVWLEQLSRAHGRDIHRLDQIPDGELDTLARRGFTALWLIGIWERSPASRRIKQLCGNAEAEASAYAIAQYEIAADLGGRPAMENLRRRAAMRGLRLASDVVPNHMGIDSPWVREHPEWFVSLPHSPFPAYQFNGPDLNGDGHIEIKIEDHYYDRTDAAVVFRRRDLWTGDTRYIYHGNDGTSFPWNDTAQLCYLRADVREAMIAAIVRVARDFPVIRFDAAMTLAKKHYQRLWFPEPGTAGPIPTRAEHGLTKAQFDAEMPEEFWREVVDRVAVEAPGTLLLAEAFWLMEGYFVRTLGMHRVYNSAFMNMLRDEQNANYRSVIKNTLEFDPDILKRYVNFMNNPDERTAVDQFGKGDKYFGICTLLATLPGLPMFGHGQFEGFTEKYGMEFRHPRLREAADAGLVAHHDRLITPLLRRRALFAEAAEFLLYDFFAPEGHVNEDVYAFSNRGGGERALVVYNNTIRHAAGWVRLSCAYAEKNGNGGKHLRQRTLAEGLDIPSAPDHWAAYRRLDTGLEHLARGEDLAQGMYFELDGYATRVLLDWRVWRDDGTRPWRRLWKHLQDRGVPNLEDALRDLELARVHRALSAVLARQPLAALAQSANVRGAAARTAIARRRRTEAEAALVAAMRELAAAAQEFLVSPAAAAAGFGPEDRISAAHAKTAIAAALVQMRAAPRLPALAAKLELPPAARDAWPPAGAAAPWAPSAAPLAPWAEAVAIIVLQALGMSLDPSAPDAAAARLFEGLRLRPALAAEFAALRAADLAALRAAESSASRAGGSAASRRGKPAGPRGTEAAARRGEHAAALRGGEVATQARQPAEDAEAPWRAAARVRAAFAHPLPPPARPAAARRTAAKPPNKRPASASAAPVPEPATASALTPLFAPWLADPDTAWLLGTHEAGGVGYIVQEQLQTTLAGLALRPALALAAAARLAPAKVRALAEQLRQYEAAAARHGYRTKELAQS
jgi:glycosidase